MNVPDEGYSETRSEHYIMNVPDEGYSETRREH
jgi:hypothetical protein